MKTFKRTTAIVAMLAFAYCFAFVPAASALNSTLSSGAGGDAFGVAYWITLALGVLALIGWGVSMLRISSMKRTIYELSVNNRFQLDKGASIAKDFLDFTDSSEAYMPSHSTSRVTVQPRAADDCNITTEFAAVPEVGQPVDFKTQVPGMHACSAPQARADSGVCADGPSPTWFSSSPSTGLQASSAAASTSVGLKNASTMPAAPSDLSSSEIKSAILADLSREKASACNLSMEDMIADAHLRASFADTAPIPVVSEPTVEEHRIGPDFMPHGEMPSASARTAHRAGTDNAVPHIMRSVPCMAAALPFI